VGGAVEGGEVWGREEGVDLLGLIDGADEVVTPDGDERRALDAREFRAAVVGRVFVADDEVADGNPIPYVRPPHETRGSQSLVEEVERTDGLKGATEALVVRERSVPQRAIGRPLLGRGLTPAIVVSAGHERAAGGRAHDGERPDRLGMARGVHESEKTAPADAEHVDRTEPERQPHALDVRDELVLRALLDRLPDRAAVAAVIVEDQTSA